MKSFLSDAIGQLILAAVVWFTTLFVLGLLGGCIPAETSPYYQHRFYEQFPAPHTYPFVQSDTTAEGVRVDTSGLSVDLDDLDRRIDAVESCLASTFGTPALIPPDVAASGQCDSDTFPLPLRRQDLEVKVAGDWVWSCDGTQQLIPVQGPDDSACLAKGLVPTPECPCYWRAGIEGNRTIVVTPDFHMMADPLVRQVTGCNDVWSTTALSKCAMPLEVVR